MTKIFKISFAVLSILMLGVLSSSCNGIDDPTSKMVAYSVDSKISGGLASSFAGTYFQDAINKSVGSGYVQANDAKVIAACDKVDVTLKEDKNLEGSVRILKTPFKGGSATLVKEYTYKKSK